ncbi:CocE/NonD family hydrolase C-terminal non-catalytic domain-containing protein [Psychrobacillus sp. L4]|uniref:CocE/NonD family hydrolase C-terminal non-catalytic domain-containing protein n=1 Tax=Psychrobacillus sp. L4 TaxID=3236892 RepID=UPI0036F3368F
MEENIVVAGELSAEIYAASSVMDTDWVVNLCVMDETRKSIHLSNYIVRAKYRNGHDAPILLEPGAIEKYYIYMQSIAYTFKKGSKIRFSIPS